ncbi:hypothetical protein CEXT_678171, partial [Caerostris extrusa]
VRFSAPGAAKEKKCCCKACKINIAPFWDKKLLKCGGGILRWLCLKGQTKVNVRYIQQRKC